MPKRKNVSWRVSEHPQSDLINDWLDQQKNIQDSITNIVLHMIDRFGVRNITDYDIQKVLYQESSSVEQKQPIAESPIQITSVATEKEQPVKNVDEPSNSSQEDKQEEDQEDDMYNEIDMNNL